MHKIEKFDLLLSFYIFCIITSEVMGAKTFALTAWPLPLNASVAIFVIPFVYSINDIIIEVFGIHKAHSVMRSGLVVVAATLAYSLLATSLPPSTRFLPMESAYDSIFGLSARIAAASLTAFAVAQFTDLFIFQKIRSRLKNNPLWVRSNISNIASHFLDTVVFVTLAFYAFNRTPSENLGFLVSVILPYWLLKCSMSFITTPLVYAGVSWLKGDTSWKS